jgi:hypothetical protein
VTLPGTRATLCVLTPIVTLIVCGVLLGGALREWATWSLSQSFLIGDAKASMDMGPTYLCYSDSLTVASSEATSDSCTNSLDAYEDLHGQPIYADMRAARDGFSLAVTGAFLALLVPILFVPLGNCTSCERVA